MDRVGAGALGDAQDLGDREIGFDRPERPRKMGPAPDLVGLVRLETVQRQLVLLGEQSDCLQPKLIGGTEDPDSNLGSIGDKDLSDVRQCVPQPTFRQLSGVMLQCNKTKSDSSSTVSIDLIG
jgi:hypothetical protein